LPDTTYCLRFAIVNCGGMIALTGGGAKPGSEVWPVMGVLEAGGGVPAPVGVMRPDCLSMARSAEGLPAREKEPADGAAGGGCTAGTCGGGDRIAAIAGPGRGRPACCSCGVADGVYPLPTGVAGLGAPDSKAASAPCPRSASSVRPPPPPPPPTPPPPEAAAPTPGVTEGGRATATGGTGAWYCETATGGVGVDTAYAAVGAGGAARMFTASSVTLSLTSIN